MAGHRLGGLEGGGDTSPLSNASHWEGERAKTQRLAGFTHQNCGMSRPSIMIHHPVFLLAPLLFSCCSQFALRFPTHYVGKDTIEPHTHFAQAGTRGSVGT